MLQHAGNLSVSDNVRPGAIKFFVNEEFVVPYDLDAMHEWCACFPVVHFEPELRRMVPMHNLQPFAMRTKITLHWGNIATNASASIKPTFGTQTARDVLT